jgi:hypothetical protein
MKPTPFITSGCLDFACRHGVHGCAGLRFAAFGQLYRMPEVLARVTVPSHHAAHAHLPLLSQ